MSERPSLPSFITLGQRLCILLNPRATHIDTLVSEINALSWPGPLTRRCSTHIDTLVSEINAFLASLRECGLQRTLVASQPLASIPSIPYHSRSGTVTDMAGAKIQAYMQPILNTLYAEASERELTAINTGAVSRELRELPTRLTLNATHQHLLAETVLCIESSAFRAAAVMAWNLAYDFIRQLVFDNRLADFNQSLTTQYHDRNANPRYASIRVYEDFFGGEPGERTVIDTCYHAQIIGEKLRDNLRYYLRRRNDYAHRSFTAPSAEQTNAYVKDLIDIITAPPFA